MKSMSLTKHEPVASLLLLLVLSGHSAVVSAMRAHYIPTAGSYGFLSTPSPSLLGELLEGVVGQYLLEEYPESIAGQLV